MVPDALQPLALALGLGLLVGLQREWAGGHSIGIRTFPLVAAFGCLCGLLAEAWGAIVLAAGLVLLGALLAVSHLVRENRATERSDDDDASEPPGLTTEIAAALIFVVGAVLAAGHTELGLAAGGALAVLLHWKQPLHHFVDRVGRNDLTAIIRWVLISLVILPVLPNRTFGPYDTINPFEIWTMVVLIVGISVVSYLAAKFIGARKGTVLGGLLGGLISSTATSVTYARRARESASSAPLGAFVVLVASAVVFVRVAIEVAVVAPSILPRVLPQFAVMTAIMAAIAGVAWIHARGSEPETPEPKDPSELQSAMVFGGLYAVVLIAVAATEQHFGGEGLYVVAAISGLTDMDAITLSTAKMITEERISLDTGWRMMVIGALANNVFKGVVVAALGGAAIGRRANLGFAASLVGGALLLWLWP